MGEQGIADAYELPTATASDNGKVLGVDDGEYKLVEHTELPSPSTLGYQVLKAHNGAYSLGKITANEIDQGLSDTLLTSQNTSNRGALFVKRNGIVVVNGYTTGIGIPTPGNGGFKALIPTGYELKAQLYVANEVIAWGTTDGGSPCKIVIASVSGSNYEAYLVDANNQPFSEETKFCGTIIYFTN